MRICENGIYRDMTPEEISGMDTANRLHSIAERTRPFTAEEVSRMFISQQINSLEVDDNTALRMKDYYPEWTTGVSYAIGYKVRRNGKLWRVVQTHTSQTTWEPENAASLWETIDETHEGTIDDPIPYNGNMALNSGSYYIQNNVVYFCNRDTGNPVYHPLADLISVYVEAV